MKVRTIAAIFTSPVKSLSLLKTGSVTVGYSGIVEGRRFHLVDEDGRLLRSVSTAAWPWYKLDIPPILKS
ncbi:MAG: hypothetical protein Ct9H300mP11_31870 [Chloroflexota bacterium]|nr:MAG: hypothetical protein Ct9H300mP11_31870 [Chloroflexota bacterium]